MNVGVGTDISIGELASLMAKVTQFPGAIEFDRGKPDGTPRKLLDISKLKALGWEPRIELEQGLAEVYQWVQDSKGLE